MILYTPSQQTVTTTYTGGNLGVGTSKDVSATIPLYLERSVTDTFAPQNTSATQSYTVTTTAPSGLLPGFYDPVTREFYQKVGSPSPATQQPVSLVASIQQPAYTQSVTAAPASFKTVPYQPAGEAAPAPKPTTPPTVSSKPVVVPQAAPSKAVSSTLEISDDVQEAVDIINTLLKKDAVQNMIADYQQNGASSLMSKAMVKRSVQLLWDSDTRQSVKQLIAILKRPDVREAITSPVLLENNDELNKVLKIFQEAGLVPSESKASHTPKKKPVVEKAEAASDSDEDDVPAEASSGEAKDIESFIKEARAAEENEDGEEPEAASPVHKHTRRKASAETTED